MACPKKGGFYIFFDKLRMLFGVYQGWFAAAKSRWRDTIRVPFGATSESPDFIEQKYSWGKYQILDKLFFMHLLCIHLYKKVNVSFSKSAYTELNCKFKLIKLLTFSSLTFCSFSLILCIIAPGRNTMLLLHKTGLG